MKLIESWNGYTVHEISGTAMTDWHRPEGKHYVVRANLSVDVDRHEFRSLYFYFIPDGYWTEMITARVDCYGHGSKELHATIGHASGGRCDDDKHDERVVSIRDDLEAAQNFASALADASDLCAKAIAEINAFFQYDLRAELDELGMDSSEPLDIEQYIEATKDVFDEALRERDSDQVRSSAIEIANAIELLNALEGDSK